MFILFLTWNQDPMKWIIFTNYLRHYKFGDCPLNRWANLTNSSHLPLQFFVERQGDLLVLLVGLCFTITWSTGLRITQIKYRRLLHKNSNFLRMHCYDYVKYLIGSFDANRHQRAVRAPFNKTAFKAVSSLSNLIKLKFA